MFPKLLDNNDPTLTNSIENIKHYLEDEWTFHLDWASSIRQYIVKDFYVGRLKGRVFHGRRFVPIKYLFVELLNLVRVLRRFIPSVS